MRTPENRALAHLSRLMDDVAKQLAPRRLYIGLRRSELAPHGHVTIMAPDDPYDRYDLVVVADPDLVDKTRAIVTQAAANGEVHASFAGLTGDEIVALFLLEKAAEANPSLKRVIDDLAQRR